MRIGVDASCWSHQRGFGRFAREILTALLAIDQGNEYLFFADRETASGAVRERNSKSPLPARR